MEPVPKAKHELGTIRVANGSPPPAVAGALAASIRQFGHVEAQAVGAGAVNQAVKAIAIARGYVAPQGVDLIVIPAFIDVQINGEARTALKFIIEPR